MVNENSDMIVLAGMFKVVLNLSLAWYGFMTVMQLADASVFLQLVETMPSKVAMFYGFCYIVFIVIRKGHDTYTHIRINQTKIKKANEEAEQEEIHTEKDRKSLNNGKE